MCSSLSSPPPTPTCVPAVLLVRSSLIFIDTQVVEDAEAQYLAFFAGKTIGMIRAPDSYVYPAPFNLVELMFVAPFEWVFRLSLPLAALSNADGYRMIPVASLSPESYATVNNLFRSPSVIL
jgi:hypothetical protein